MAVTIMQVKPGSIAGRHGIQPGDQLVSINGHKIVDVLDYQYYMTNRRLKILLLRQSGESYEVGVHKGEYDDLGLDFETYLMDRQHSCRNKCIFCFVDQTPKGMRPSLYFKDDDSRMSFFFGNYITLTNMSDEEIDRIIQMKISPINISVHTTNPQLRVQMMANPRAADSLDYLKRLAQGGAKLNTQLVLCPGINDGEELRRTLRDLGEYYPSLQSIACVPVGLTAHREGLYHLEPYTPQQAAQVSEIVTEFSDAMLERHGERVAYAADEFYLKAGLPIPPSEYYGEFNQLENGVGLIALLRQEFLDALELAEDFSGKREVSIATGMAAFPLLEELAGLAMERFPGLRVKVWPIVNDFFGHTITVAGLVTGQDLIAQLRGKDLGSQLLIPSVMLRHEQDKFLDDVTIGEAREALGPIQVLEIDGGVLLDAMLGVGSC